MRWARWLTCWAKRTSVTCRCRQVHLTVTGTAALVAAAAPVVLDRSPPPPAAVMSLADTQFSTGRPEAPESTIGGQSTCITNSKSHVAVPCGHQCACDHCSAQMQECPVCRRLVQTWVHVHVA